MDLNGFQMKAIDIHASPKIFTDINVVMNRHAPRKTKKANIFKADIHETYVAVGA